MKNDTKLEIAIIRLCELAGHRNYYRQFFNINTTASDKGTVSIVEPAQEDKERTIKLIQNAIGNKYTLWQGQNKPYYMKDRRVFWKNRKGGKA